MIAEIRHYANDIDNALSDEVKLCNYNLNTINHAIDCHLRALVKVGENEKYLKDMSILIKLQIIFLDHNKHDNKFLMEVMKGLRDNLDMRYFSDSGNPLFSKYDKESLKKVSDVVKRYDDDIERIICNKYLYYDDELVRIESVRILGILKRESSLQCLFEARKQNKGDVKDYITQT